MKPGYSGSVSIKLENSGTLSGREKQPGKCLRPDIRWMEYPVLRYINKELVRIITQVFKDTSRLFSV